VIDMTGIKVKCKDCKKEFEIDPDTPIGEAIPGHMWSKGRNFIRHIREDDRKEMETWEAERCQKEGL